MEEKTQKKIAKLIFIVISVTYLVLVGPISFINDNKEFHEPLTYGAAVLSIPEKYKYLAAGDDLVVETQLYQFDLGKKNDIIIDYEIQNIEGNVILKQHETVAVETQASFLKTFNLPFGMSSGRYIVFFSIKDLDQKNIANSSTSFEITKVNPGYQQSQFAWFSPQNTLVAISTFLFLFLFAMFFIIRKKEKEELPISPLKKPDYKDLIEAIIKFNNFFGKKKSVELANRIKGLKVSPEGKVEKLSEKGLEIMINLIDLHRISIGESSIKIAREAIHNLIPLNPQLIVPKELKTA